MTRYTEHGKPSEVWGRAALGAGLLSLVPLAAPFAATLSVLASLVGTMLSARYPEKFAGGRKILAGLCFCVLGMGLFFAEGTLFLRWKITQAYDQRIAISRFRMTQIAQALESCRQETGAYPDLNGIMLAKAKLEPKYISSLPTLDGFDGAISIESRADGFVLMAYPPPAPGSGESMAPPLIVSGGFQPAPSPPPPAPAEAQPTEGAAGSEPAGPPSSATPAKGGTPAPAPQAPGAPTPDGQPPPP